MEYDVNLSKNLLVTSMPKRLIQTSKIMQTFNIIDSHAAADRRRADILNYKRHFNCSNSKYYHRRYNYSAVS